MKKGMIEAYLSLHDKVADEIAIYRITRAVAAGRGVTRSSPKYHAIKRTVRQTIHG